MEFLEEMEGLGVDVKEGLDRVMGDESLYSMMFDMLITTIENTPIQPEDFDGDKLDELIGKVHSLKGTTGNLSVTPLFDLYNKALTLLRANRPAEAKAAYIELMPVQQTIIECIKRHQNA